jgi:hypothetical protein
MAKAGQGRFEIISESESTDAIVLSQLSSALKPALTNLRVNWDWLSVNTLPSRFPPLFAGNRFVVYGFLDQKIKG